MSRRDDETTRNRTPGDGNAPRLLGSSAPQSLAAGPHPNRTWADLLIDELVRCGVGLFCLAPGSRSTPLVQAVASNPKARHLMHFDERGTAFAALGWARATGRPAAWITTSGTAVANGLPAVVEASVDGVPLVLLTADRPPELRDTGANQTITQPNIFGAYVRWRFDLPAPSDEIDPAFVLTTADQAVHRALGRPRGPVHLNCMFREPLAAAPTDHSLLRSSGERLARWRDSGAPYTRYAAPEPRLERVREDHILVRKTPISELADQIDVVRRGVVERGLVVAGRLRTRAEGEAAIRLAETLGWPLLPDVGSQMRFTKHAVACPFYDQALGNEAFCEAFAPEAVIYLGGRATSKRLAYLLADARPDPFIVVRDDPFRFDPDHVVTDRFEADIEAFCHALADEIAGRPSKPTPWLQAWHAASSAAADTLDDHFSESDALTEPAVARRVTARAEAGLVLAASMPVREADAFALEGGAAPLVASNRGASGIDGTVATAAGFARGLGAPVTLLIGDLALLHDLNSLALLRDGPPVTVVALNNDGGGIFHFLPIAEHETAFEPYFGTPHGLGFEHAARMFGLVYHRPDTLSGLDSALEEARSSGRSALVEVRTERVANRTLHADLLARCAAAVDESVLALR